MLYHSCLTRPVEPWLLEQVVLLNTELAHLGNPTQGDTALVVMETVWITSEMTSKQVWYTLACVFLENCCRGSL